jgi:hypothetical protein
MLTEDLIALGFDPITVHPLPLCAALPDCGDSAAAFGCLYVTEASYGYKWLCGEDAVANCERNR